jgi:hypothetical protein
MDTSQIPLRMRGEIELTGGQRKPPVLRMFANPFFLRLLRSGH